jgi:hypothetical protein
MDAETLFYRLLKAEDETEVDGILQQAGYLNDDPDIWQPFGEYEMNFNLIGNQQADPTAALVEKVINAIDAVLMSENFKRGIDPESQQAPQSMVEAVETFFGVRDGRLENLLAKQQTALADNIHLIAVGAKKSPSYLIIDRGEGQTPDAFPETFLSLHRSNKMRIPFVQGKFNSGGTGILQFCGRRNYELIASRRHPASPSAPVDQTRDLWGFTLVRRLLPGGGRKSSVYVYLAPKRKIFSFAAEGIKVLPGGSSADNPAKPYAVELKFGTCIKLYNYRWKARSVATTEARYELERYLHSPCLPFRITETRDYKANYYSTTLSGVWVGVNLDAGDEGKKVEKGFPADGMLNLPNVGPLPYQIVLFRPDVSSRHFPHGIYFTVNGQVHGQLPANFVSANLKFDYLSDSLLVSVDSTAMNEQVREDFFMASRDRLRRNEVYYEIQEGLKEELKNHAGLREHNALRRQRDLEKALSDEREAVDFFQSLIKSDPSIASLLGLGNRLVTTTGPTDESTFAGRKFPTYFRLSKEPKAGLVKHCPVNRTVRIEFETDGENNYFTRADSPGHIEFDPPNLSLSSHLWNGEFSTRLQMPWNANVGDVVEVTVKVSDVERDVKGGPFVCKFILKGTPEVDQPTSSPGPTPKPKPKPDTNGKQATPGLGLPTIVEVRRDEWDKPLLNFNEFSAIRITHNEENGYIFYINVENTFLLTEMTRARDDDKPLMKFWFVYGLTLCAMGILQDEKRRLIHMNDERAEPENGGDEEGVENVDRVSRYCTGLSRVIVPIIRRLYRGPEAGIAHSAEYAN